MTTQSTGRTKQVTMSFYLLNLGERLSKKICHWRLLFRTNTAAIKIDTQSLCFDRLTSSDTISHALQNRFHLTMVLMVWIQTARGESDINRRTEKRPVCLSAAAVCYKYHLTAFFRLRLQK